MNNVVIVILFAAVILTGWVCADIWYNLRREYGETEKGPERAKKLHAFEVGVILDSCGDFGWSTE